MLVWLNGKLLERASATVSAFDAGLQHAIGLFETMTACNGRVFRAMHHTTRLVESAKTLLLSDRLRAEPLAEAVDHVVERNELDEARVRLTVTGGDLNMLTAPRGTRVDPTILIDAQPPTRYPDVFFQEGVMVTIARERANPTSPMAGHKTLDYWRRIHALQHAAAERAGEALWFTTEGELASGSVSNVFCVRDGGLTTPSARGEQAADADPPPVLPGITRQAVLELAEAEGIETRRERLAIGDVLGAEEVFLTNSSWGVLPVVAVEQEKIGTGTVGPITRRLLDAYRAVLEQETA
ncbi:MAG: aminotransferase class IV [Planctomycetota bacterium]|jgi:branched-subunit amino acid aminotransferase/4-amino-4-deoxychorismate lyase